MIVQTYVDIIKLEDILSRLNIAMAHPFLSAGKRHPERGAAFTFL